jgi:hypothetical protein
LSRRNDGCSQPLVFRGAYVKLFGFIRLPAKGLHGMQRDFWSEREELFENFHGMQRIKLETRMPRHAFFLRFRW